MNTKRTKSLFKKAYRYNWDNGIGTLLNIIQDKDCDKATALMIFWLGSPHYFYNQVAVDELQDYEKPNYDLLKAIEKKVLNNEYETLIIYDLKELHKIDELGNIPIALSELATGTIKYEDIIWPNNNPFQEEILAICQKCDSVEQFYELEEKGADFTKKILNGYAHPLEVLVNWGQTEALKYFIERKFDFAKKYNKNPLVFTAIESKQVEIVKQLVESGINVNKKGQFGRTPLHHIAGFGENNGFDDKMEEIANYLLEKGAKIDLGDTDKKTPLDLAEMWENEKYIKFIESKKS